MSGKGKGTSKPAKRTRAETQLASHLKSTDKAQALQELLYDSDVDYGKLRKVLKNLGESEPDKLSKSQVTRKIEQFLKQGVLSLNMIRKALGKPQKAEPVEEEEESKEEEETKPKAASAKKGKAPAAKRAKTACTPNGAAAAAAKPEERRTSGIFEAVKNFLLSPLRK